MRFNFFAAYLALLMTSVLSPASAAPLSGAANIDRRATNIDRHGTHGVVQHFKQDWVEMSPEERLHVTQQVKNLIFPAILPGIKVPRLPAVNPSALDVLRAAALQSRDVSDSSDAESEVKRTSRPHSTSSAGHGHGGIDLSEVIPSLVSLWNGLSPKEKDMIARAPSMFLPPIFPDLLLRGMPKSEPFFLDVINFPNMPLY